MLPQVPTLPRWPEVRIEPYRELIQPLSPVTSAFECQSHSDTFEEPIPPKPISNRAPEQPSMSTQRALWFVASKASKKPSPQGTQAGTIYIHCHVKPGASKTREGVTSVTDEAVEICVAAQAKEGEANKAVVKVLSEVSVSSL